MVHGLRIGLRWDEMLRMPVRCVLALIVAEAEWREDRARDLARMLDRNPKLMRVFDVGGLA